jgi:enediyne biosynthesis protein E4
MRKIILLTLSFFATCIIAKSQTLFTRIPSDSSGLQFMNYLLESKDFNSFSYEYLYNGGGVAAGDINNDGLTDLFFSSSILPNKLFLNQGNLKFKDISVSSGIAAEVGYFTGVTMVDINNDGLLDIYVCKSAAVSPQDRRNALYINNGNLTFTNKAKAYGLDDASYHTQAYFNDMDLDGDIDLFLLNHPRDMHQANNVNLAYNKAGKLVAVMDTQRTYFSYRYYVNNNNKFVDKTMKAGLGTYAFGLSAVIDDFNNDGYPDIYTCNDYHQPDFLYINNKNGTFTNKFSDYFRHTSYSAMGSDYADINNDGFSDLMVVDMMAESIVRQKQLVGPGNYDNFNKRVDYGLGYQYVKNVLQLNNGNGSYSDISYLAGVPFTDWSWAPLIVDLDNDGLKDIYVTNGYFRDVTNLDFSVFEADSIRKAMYKVKSDEEAMALLAGIPSVKIQNYFYRNNGNLTFTNQSVESGMNDFSWSSGAIYADLDNDGDLELVVNNLNDEAFLYKNNTIENRKGNFIRFKLDGPAKNKSGLFTTVEIETPDGKKQYQRYYPTKGFLSSHERFVHFGIAANESASIKVIWPDKKFIELKSLAANRVYTLNYAEAVGVDTIKKEITPTVFTDITESTNINYKQTENPYIDFKLEPLLPHQFSRMGPCISVADVNGDKFNDIYIGGSKGVEGTLYVQDVAGKFKKLNQSAFTSDKKYEDTGSEFFDADNDGDQDLIVVSGGNESPNDNSMYVVRLYSNDGKGVFSRNMSFPEIKTSGKAIAIDDFDKDGFADIFLGGRVVPGHYGIIPSSYLLKNNKGVFTDITSGISDLSKIGMVTDATWCDTDNDGWKELIMVGEWMPLTFYKNNAGQLNAAPNQMAATYGWWNTIAHADLDGDGDEDLIGGNVGLNTRYRGDENSPVTMVANDFDKNGSTDCVVSVYENGVSYPIVLRDQILDQMIFLKKKYLRYKDYSNQTVNDIFTAEQLKSATFFKANHMTSSIFINDGKGTFTPQLLSVRAQIAPVNAIITEDVDKDGKTDLLLAGNDYSTEVETGRNDAGIGLLLRNQGGTSFKSIPVSISGFYLPGDVKCVKRITINNKTCFIAGKNQGRVQVLGYR